MFTRFHLVRKRFIFLSSVDSFGPDLLRTRTNPGTSGVEDSSRPWNPVPWRPGPSTENRLGSVIKEFQSALFVKIPES